MVKFSKLNEATLLHNLRVRYARDDIYSRAGSILLSVNPFKQLPIYTSQQMLQCKVRKPADEHSALLNSSMGAFIRTPLFVATPRQNVDRHY